MSQGALRTFRAGLAVAGTIAGLLVAVTTGTVTAGVPAGASTWQPDPLRYGVATTTDLPVRLSDGRVLRASVSTPTDPATGEPAAGPFPVILAETPYGKSLQPPIPTDFVRRGYLAVTVDVAGTGGSDGQFALFGPQEAKDSAEVIDWAAQRPHSNGRVGMYGGSYLAIDQVFAAAAVGPNSPLKAIFPIDASIDPYRDLFTSGGVPNLESSLGLLGIYYGVRQISPPIERPTDIPAVITLLAQRAASLLPVEGGIAADVFTNGARRFDEAFWRERAPETVLPQLVANGVAAYFVGGQYDVFQRGEPQLYSQLQNLAVGRPQYAPMVPGQAVDPRYQLLFGPWDHSTRGGVDRINTTALRWFDQWLKQRDTGILDTQAPLHVVKPGGAEYDTRNYPAAGVTPQRYYLAGSGGLTTSAPTARTGADPLLFTGVSQLCTRSTQQWSAGAIPPNVCGDKDPAPLPKPVQLSYTSAPMTSDTRLSGPVGLTLRTTATSADTMYTATVLDVAPDGTARALSAGAQLGSLRAVDESRSWSAGGGSYLLPYHPMTTASQQRVVPHRVTRYDIEIRPIFATVAAGHRIRVVLGTGDLPHLAPPPATGLRLAGLSQVQRNAAAASWLDLPVVR